MPTNEHQRCLARLFGHQDLHQGRNMDWPESVATRSDFTSLTVYFGVCCGSLITHCYDLDFQAQDSCVLNSPNAYSNNLDLNFLGVCYAKRFTPAKVEEIRPETKATTGREPESISRQSLHRGRYQDQTV